MVPDPQMQKQEIIVTCLQALCSNYRRDLTDDLVATWAGSVDDLSNVELGQATKRCIQHLKCEYPPHFPTVAQFRELAVRVEPRGRFTAQAAEPEWRGLPEPEWVKQERYDRSRAMLGKLHETLADADPPMAPEPDRKTSRFEGTTSEGQRFVMWKDSQGRDFVHYPGHPVHETPQGGGGRMSEQERYDNLKGNYANAFNRPD